MDYICYYRCFRALVSILKDSYSSDKALQNDIQTWKAYHLTPPGDTAYKHAGLFKYGSPHLGETCAPGYHLLIPVDGFIILMEHMPFTGRILKFKIKLERQWTSSSRDAQARKDAIVTGVITRETTVALGVSAKGV